MIYRSKLYKSSPNGKTNILLGLISRNKLTLLLNVTIIIKTEKMQRNKLPFALQRRIIQSLILLIILTPLYIYIALTSSPSPKLQKLPSTNLTPDTALTDTIPLISPIYPH